MDGNKDVLLSVGFYGLYTLLTMTWYILDPSFNLGITLLTGLIFVGVYFGLTWFLSKSLREKREVILPSPPKKEEASTAEPITSSAEAPLSTHQSEVYHELN